MNYLKVEWCHDHPDEPAALYSELDDERWEVRKVEVYRSGALDFAGRGRSTGTTRRAEVRIPPIQEIAAQRGFVPQEISGEEFEEIWAKAVSSRAR